MKKILEAVKRNTMLKVFSVILAILLWAFVQLAQNPEVSYDVLEIPITITGEAGINNADLVIGDPTDSMIASVTISTKRSYIKAVKDSSITATVDVSAVKEAGNHSLPVKVLTSDANIDIISHSPSNISLSVDHMIVEEKEIQISYDGKLDSKYYIDTENTEITPEKVKVKLPALKANNVSKIMVHVDMTNVTSDINGPFKGVPVDQNGNELADLSLSIVDDVNVYVPVLRRKTVQVELANIPENLLDNYELNHSEIEVAMREEDLDTINVIYGTISYNPTHPLSAYPVVLDLPEGVVRSDSKDLVVRLLQPNEQ